MPDAGAMQENFTLGRPSLVCRWRIAGGDLPMAGRHLRALGQRRVNGAIVSPNLVAWAQQHVEWTLHDGSAQHPDGVLMLIVDEGGRAAMTVGPYEPLAVATASGLAGRAFQAAREGDETGVVPETLWAVRGGDLLWGVAPGSAVGAASGLMADLAQTVGLNVIRCEGLVQEVRNAAADGLLGSGAGRSGAEPPVSEVFLVSDEHGVVQAADLDGPRGRRFAQGYARLLESVRAKAAERPRIR